MDDVDNIVGKLKLTRFFQRMHPSLLQQICKHAIVERLDKSVVVFRQGDKAFNWYAVVTGSLDVQVNAKAKEVVTLCTLGVGTAFGESVLTGKPHSVSIITNEPCTLLRVRKDEFQEIWDQNSHLMTDIVTPLVGLRCLKRASFNKSLSIRITSTNDNCNSTNQSSESNNNSNNSSKNSSNNNCNIITTKNSTKSNNSLDSLSYRFKSIQRDQSVELLQIGRILRALIIAHDPSMIRDRKYNVGLVYRNCLVGSELVDWLISASSVTPKRIHSRSQAAAMLQVLLEENVLTSPTGDSQFWDKYLFYRFIFDGEDESLRSEDLPSLPSFEGKRRTESALVHCLTTLHSLAPEANFRLILCKSPKERSAEEVDLVYEELMHIKALSHLGNSVRKELASVIAFEKHPRKGTVLFNQGDPGKSWYIILKGTVNVVIVGKGVVCTLCEGDDFGKLALVNDAPRAATIITNEDNCHFLRVDKDNFNRILRDVEANTVHLKEHGRDVLLLRKMVPKVIPSSTSSTINGSSHHYPPTAQPVTSGSPQPTVNPQVEQQKVTSKYSSSCSHYKYMVLAGTPEKMLEHLLETRIDVTSPPEIACALPSSVQLRGGGPLELIYSVDTFLEDFVLTHIVFLKTDALCVYLLKHYKIDLLNTRQEKEFIIGNKKRVIRFVKIWFNLISEVLHRDSYVTTFVDKLYNLVKSDLIKYEGFLEDELALLESICKDRKRFEDDLVLRGTQKWKNDLPGPIRRLSTNGLTDNLIAFTNIPDDWLLINLRFNSIQPKDEIISRIYCADHTYTTLKMTIDSTAGAIKIAAADKLGLNKEEGELILAEVKSTGERVLFDNQDVSIQTGLSVNGRIFVSLIDHIDALTPLPEQEGPKIESFSSALEDISSQDIAYYLTYYSWLLFQNVHEYEFIYHVFGRVKFGHITANLDLFLRLFNEIQYWVVTEIVLTTSLSKRVQILRKFIKVAGLCKEHQNLSIFFAITMGLSNIAVSRLTQTWERLPNKLKRTFSQYESLIDPSRNHRKYRVYLSKLEAPIIPFTPLILKDMTFSHEGNKTYLENNLINFEKMVMLSQSLRTFRFCRSKPMKLDSLINGSSNSNYSNRGIIPSTRKAALIKIDQYIKDLKVIDNQRLLLHLSHSLEHRRI
ncbi:LOW QUALITY PROTEIN: rap guanine nucleotide exchange factor 4-like [Tetranychus urticae]|uniref:LOW QUALITY PROTEIN: rap guanine nucleotide exchange factor 4-like n=1 Tax=Tetranychus urticae TaxID=32264 RepID=UPI00077BEE14|nr:LOW QUALITY PROTEIN: rap guanine nucleotide exchange factor 4-like [Tetranychus urticae]